MAADALALTATVTRWPMTAPFVIHGYQWQHMDVATVTVCRGDKIGWGEGAPLFYDEETAEALVAALLALSSQDVAAFEADRSALQTLPSGARNALDAAMIDLAAKEAGVPAHNALGIDVLKSLMGLATVTLGTPHAMAAQARALHHIPILKLKLGGKTDLDAAIAVRDARPDATLITDVNCGWTLGQLEEAIPTLVALDFAMIEQPLPPEDDTALEGLESPIPLCADESCRTFEDVEAIKSRYQMINIKLDKCGGLTAALTLAEKARSAGLEIMVGNMLGSSLAMAPAFLLAQQAKFADLDGPLYLEHDCENGLSFAGGQVHPPSADLWG